MNRGIEADSARAWIAAAAPPDMAASLGASVGEWAEGNLPVFALWRFLGRRLGSAGLLDPARDAARRAVAAADGDPLPLAELARLDFAAGDDTAARALAERVPAGHPSRLDARLLLAEMSDRPDTGLAAEIAGLLHARPDWGDAHELWHRLLRRHGLEDAAGFLMGWMKACGAGPTPLMHMAQILLEGGHADQAAPILANLWRANEDSLGPVIGRHHAAIPPDPAAEADLRHRIEAAQALPEDGLPIHPLPTPPSRLPERVLYVGPDQTGTSPSFPNDLAQHLGDAARAAGGSMAHYADPAITGPDRPRMTDAARAGRIAAFIDHLRRTRPQVVILDCCWSPMRGDIDPAALAAVKAETGLSLLCLFRDAQEPSISLIRHWAALADGLILPDPFSPVFDAANADLAAKALVIPIPAPFGPEPPPQPRHGLLFIGGLGQFHRPILVGALTETGIDFTAILGTRRRELAPDLAAYAALLADSRAVLNIAVHHRDQRLITGRVWETIAAGGLLLEQTGSATPRFFQPYRHYLPWSDMADIVHACRMLAANDDLRRTIIASARDWSARHYAPARVWGALMALSGHDGTGIPA
ncbi:glycosyltransferase [Magnetospirillum sp. SS-4]|uniref:glycosyltransferase n=1 Tax=Magnetospirillum sp. SS-4 TaxID=2681465 RepID=UPI0013838F33|nr:glycosyltransferase [Magnetospirillum sp. SS-4]CAA7615576.1 hypothetical protein MTBSS4_130095 [Magnetospirillum sp. SS-4]